MPRLNIGGRWVGEFSYHAGANPNIPQGGFGFTFEARRGWFGHFRGTVQDDPHGSEPRPEVATISGYVSGTSVFFRKVYPVLRFITEDERTMALSDYMAEINGIEIDAEVASPPIRYIGEYDEVEQVIRGTWEFSKQATTFTSRGRRFTLGPSQGSGDWYMRRAIE